MKKHKLSLGVVLPDEAAACDACIQRLLKALGGRPGISGAHVDRADAAAPRLCLHYDATVVGVEDIQRLVASAGAELKAKYEHLSVPLSGLRHERQARLVEGVFAKQPGVLHAVVSFGSRRLYVEFDPTVTSRSALLAVTSRADVATREESATPAEAEHEHD